MTKQAQKPTIKRFYKQAGIAQEAGQWVVQLDGRAIRTKGGAPLAVPVQALAHAIAQEWNAQGEEVLPDAMAFMQITSAALDYVTPYRAEVEEEMLRYADTDVLFYREATGALAEAQIKEWDPVLDWARKAFSIAPKLTIGVMPVEQDACMLETVEKQITELDNLTLAVAWMMTKHLGSALLMLAVLREKLTAEQAFSISRLEERVQNEQWGEDDEAMAKREAARIDMCQIGEYYRLLSAK